MGLFANKAEVEIFRTPDVLRISVRARPTGAGLLITAAGIMGFGALSASGWRHTAVLERVVEILCALGAVFAWFRQLSGSEEEIEIGGHGVRISKRGIWVEQSFGISA